MSATSVFLNFETIRWNSTWHYWDERWL